MLKKALALAGIVGGLALAAALALAQIQPSPMLSGRATVGAAGAVPTDISPLSVQMPTSTLTNQVIAVFNVTTSTAVPFTGSTSITEDADGVVCASVPCSLPGNTAHAAQNYTSLAGTHTFAVAATMNAATITRTVTLTITSGIAASPPQQAIDAGFTTPANHMEFNDPFWANKANWLDCNNTNNSVVWHMGWGNAEISPKCSTNIFQEFDAVAGDYVMTLQVTSDMPAAVIGTYPDCELDLAGILGVQTIQAVNQGGPPNNTISLGFPLGIYFQFETRITNAAASGSCGGGVSSMFLGSFRAAAGNTLGEEWFEPDPGETTNSPTLGGDGAAHRWTSATGDTEADLTWTDYFPKNDRLPAGWTPTDYHVYGMLLTQRGDGPAQACHWVDNLFQRCVGFNFQFAATLPLPLGVAFSTGSGQAGVAYKYYVKNMRVWSCPNWQNQMQQQDTSVCTGSQFFDSGGPGPLRYYHN